MSKSSSKFLVKLLALPLILSSCGQGNEESAIAKNITLTTSQTVIVLPNFLSDTGGQTCTAGGVTGPRVRFKASVKWVGEGDLLPLVFRLEFSDSRLSAEFAGTVSPAGTEESLASYFALMTDFIPPGDTTHSTDECFFDYGTLPGTKIVLKGAARLEIPVTITMMGVVRDAEGNDTPFIKEVTSTITYVAGSVPVK